MNKKIITLIVAIIVAALVGLGIWMMSSKSNNKSSFDNTSSNSYEDSSVNNGSDNISDEENTNNNHNIGVIYFSASGTTKRVAEVISKETGGKLVEIVPKEKYTDADLNWNNSKSRTSIECNDVNSRPEIENKIDVDSFDIIYLGYPIWWGDVPHIILTFMDNYKLDGKTIIPFCTSGGTGISGSINTLKNYNKNVNWINGARLGTSENEIVNWINSLNY